MVRETGIVRGIKLGRDGKIRNDGGGGECCCITRTCELCFFFFFPFVCWVGSEICFLVPFYEI